MSTNFIQVSLTLNGISASQFTDAVQTTFKTAVAFGLSGVTADMVSITSFNRRGVNVNFQVALPAGTDSSLASSTLTSFLTGTGSGGFAQVLKDTAASHGTSAALSAVTVSGVSVQACSGSCGGSSSSSGLSTGAIVGIVIGCIVVVGIIAGVFGYLVMGSKRGAPQTVVAKDPEHGMRLPEGERKELENDRVMSDQTVQI